MINTFDLFMNNSSFGRVCGKNRIVDETCKKETSFVAQKLISVSNNNKKTSDSLMHLLIMFLNKFFRLR